MVSTMEEKSDITAMPSSSHSFVSIESVLENWRRQSPRSAAQQNPFNKVTMSKKLSDFQRPTFETLASYFRLGTSKTITVVWFKTDQDGSSGTRQVQVVVDDFPQSNDLLTDEPSFDIDDHRAQDPFLEAANAQDDANVRLAIALNAYRVFGIRENIGSAIIDSCLQLGDLRMAIFLADEVRHYAEQNNNTILSADWNERCGLLIDQLVTVDPNTGRDVTDKLARTSQFYYRMAKSFFIVSGDGNGRSRAFILEMRATARAEPTRKRRWVLRLYDWVWLYGESPIMTIRNVSAVWIGFALLFMLSGIRNNEQIIQYSSVCIHNFTFRKLISDFGCSLYFSIVTMTTLGYGDWTPASVVSRIFAGVEALLGIVLVAMIIASMQKRYGS